MTTPKRMICGEALSLSPLLIAQGAFAQPAGAPPLGFVTLRDHVGTAEKVHLDLYFIGFPTELQADMQAGVGRTLTGLNIEDAKPWWIPNIPKYGASDFAAAPAPGSLPSGDVPPDGLLRYQPSAMQKQVAGGTTTWIPEKEIGDLVSDWHQNADIVNYVEHAGSYRGVPWRIQGLQVHFLPAGALNGLIPLLTRSQRTLKSTDTFGQLLYQDVNMYTTAGLSTVWSQSVSEWNGTGPHGGMQASLFRSHAREEMAAAEAALTQATAAFEGGFSKNSRISGLLQGAVKAHSAGLRDYDNWDYRGVLFSAEEALSLTSKSLALMGQAGSLHDPLEIKPLAPEVKFQPAIDSTQIEQALHSLTLDRYQSGVRLLSAH